MKLKTKRRLLVLLIVLTIIFIWGNSILPHEVSLKISSFVMQVLGIDRETGSVSEFQVRKMGHFFEFLVLGAEMAMFLWLWECGRKSKIITLSSCAMFFPLVDETIQTLNDRHAMIRDVWIDVSGFLIGCLISLLICTLAGLIRKAVSQKNEGHGERSES